MSKKIVPLKKPGSNFDRNEKFGLSNVPKHFESVTDEEIKRLKESAMDEIEKVSQYKPGALEDALKGVDGYFEDAYSTLEGDYSTRLSNLNDVYTKGLTGIRQAYDDFVLQVAEYNALFENYSEANMHVNGKEISKDLIFSKDAISEIKRKIDELDKESKND